MNSGKSFYKPIIYSFVLIVGILLGMLLDFNSKTSFQQSQGFHGNSKIENVINFISENYVDKVNKDSIQELALVQLLQKLDPHSDYIPASDLQAVNEPLQGNFEGIGVEFNILDDTITVVNPIAGGPSEKAGILSGDKIVNVEGINVAGTKITNKKVFELLRGKKDTKVKIKIKRYGAKALLDFVITRGEIPIYSIDASYMLTSQIGYVKISRFAASTYSEYLNAFNKLKSSGMSKLVLDLRGNGGGYLNSAVELADEFLNKGMQIVFTKGNASPKKEYRASTKGGFESSPLIVLIDEGSASASEILAGAIQDNDRGVIMGRRSFGKGLVQEQLDMPDGSAIRLTTARYYTPSGRCIQKPYDKGLEEYYNEEYSRFQSGELTSVDSVKFADSLKYHTVSGKIVYGGGGIMPDVFVALDTTFRTSFLNKVIYAGLTSDFALDYVTKNRNQLKTFSSPSAFIENFQLSTADFNAFLSLAEKNKIKANAAEISKSSSYLKNQLKSLIGRNLFGNEIYYQIVHKNDNVIIKAIKELN